MTSKKTKITLTKIIKLPIEGIQYSNKQVDVSIEYDPQGFNLVEASDEINQILTRLREDDPDWIVNPQKFYPSKNLAKHGKNFKKEMVKLAKARGNDPTFVSEIAKDEAEEVSIRTLKRPKTQKMMNDTTPKRKVVK